MPKSKNKRRRKYRPDHGRDHFSLGAALVLGGILFYNGQLKPASSQSEQITFTVNQENR
ncbi:MAG: hypothetical protein ACLSA6_07265 [Holdemania massiliensis]